MTLPNNKSLYRPSYHNLLHRLIVFVFSLYVALTPLDDFLGIPGTTRTVLFFLGIATVIMMGIELLINGHILQPSRAAWTLLLWLIYALLSSLWAQDPDKSLNRISTLAGLYMIYLTTSIYPWRRQDFEFLGNATLVLGSAASLFGIYQYFTLGVSYLNTGRASLFVSPFRRVDPNEFAVNLLIPGIFALHHVLDNKGAKRSLSSIALALISVMILLTGSRGGILQATITLLSYLLLRRSDIRFSQFIGVILVLSVCLLLAYQMIPPQVVARLGLASILYDQGTGRFAVWRMGLKAFIDRPLFGYGLFNFPYAYDLYSAIYWPTNYRGRFLGWHRSAHNLYLQTAVELGILGLAILLWAIWSHYKIIRALISKKEPLASACGAIFIAMVSSGLTLEVATSKSFWIAFGLVQAVNNISRTNIAKETHETTSP